MTNQLELITYQEQPDLSPQPNTHNQQQPEEECPTRNNQQQRTGETAFVVTLDSNYSTQLPTDCSQTVQPLDLQTLRNQNKPLTYLGLAQCTLLCFFPTSIVAILYASRVQSTLSRGDIARARQYSNSAMTWSALSIAIGFILYFLGLAIFLAKYFGAFSYLPI